MNFTALVKCIFRNSYFVLFNASSQKKRKRQLIASPSPTPATPKQRPSSTPELLHKTHLLVGKG